MSLNHSDIITKAVKDAQKHASSDASKLLIIGTHDLAVELAIAYRAIRPIVHISVSLDAPDQARLLCGNLRREGFQAEVCLSLEHCTPLHDMIVCFDPTRAPDPQWIRPHQYVTHFTTS